MIIITIIYAIFYATSMCLIYKVAWDKGFYESFCTAKDIVDEIAKEYNLSERLPFASGYQVER